MTRIPQPLQRLKSLIVNNFVTIRRTSKTYRNRVLYGSGMNSQTRSFEVLRTEAANIHDFGYQSNNIAKKVNWLDTVEAFLIKPRLVKIGKLKLRPFTLSEFCGHGSFLCLAMGYLTSDLLQLRIFAFSGISLSVVFQYYRPQPLWIPIKWNALFLLINGMMIAILLKVLTTIHTTLANYIAYLTLTKTHSPSNTLEHSQAYRRHLTLSARLSLTITLQHSLTLFITP
jgi:hypothetical protein